MNESRNYYQKQLFTQLIEVNHDPVTSDIDIKIFFARVARIDAKYKIQDLMMERENAKTIIRNNNE